MYFYRFFALCVFLIIVSIFIYGCHGGLRPVEELEDIQRITKEELKTKMGDPSVGIIDVRYKPNWQKSNRLIAGALREEPMEVGSWIHKYPKDRMIVLYCD
jgi:hypothetical protein